MREFVVVCVACAACGSSGAGPADSGTEAAPDADFGQPSTTYPAFMPRVPQVVAAGGPVMASVRVVPVFYSADALQAQLVDFLGKLATSTRWSDAMTEYGVGALSIATPVVLGSAPATIDDAAIRAIVASGLDGTHPEWGPTDAATLATSVYVLYLPATAKLNDTTYGVQSCANLNGYHAYDVSGFIYGAVWECTPGTPPTGVSMHELAEAATDPKTSVLPAFQDVDVADFAWQMAAMGGEVGDLCGPAVGGGGFVVPDVGYKLARIWSNAAMKGFHDPCVPRPDATPYFASIPRFDEDVTIGGANASVTTKAVTLRVGESKTVDVDLLSDAPTAPWTVSAVELPEPGQPPALTLSLDRTSGANGEKVHLAVTAPANAPAAGRLVDLASTLGTTTRHWYGLVMVSP